MSRGCGLDVVEERFFHESGYFSLGISRSRALAVVGPTGIQAGPCTLGGDFFHGLAQAYQVRSAARCLRSSGSISRYLTDGFGVAPHISTSNRYAIDCNFRFTFQPGSRRLCLDENHLRIVRSGKGT